MLGRLAKMHPLPTAYPHLSQFRMLLSDFLVGTPPGLGVVELELVPMHPRPTPTTVGWWGSPQIPIGLQSHQFIGCNLCGFEHKTGTPILAVLQTQWASGQYFAHLLELPHRFANRAFPTGDAFMAKR
jgi:hypothetical protein